jgi:hypothetical protein
MLYKQTIILFCAHCSEWFMFLVKTSLILYLLNQNVNYYVPRISYLGTLVWIICQCEDVL